MTAQRHVVIIVGTRPEAVKLLPVVDACRALSTLKVTLVATAQHRGLLDQVLDTWNVKPDVDLNLMKPNQDPSDVTASVLTAMRPVVRELDPDILVLQGDTTTTLAAALAGFYSRVPVAHVEAGLRTWNKFAPYPEEMNRRLTSALTDVHFSPTLRASNNLLREGVAPDRIHVTGNTVIDALLHMQRRLHVDAELRSALDARYAFLPDGRLLLVTAHRRESFGHPFEGICEAIREVALLWQDVHVVFPVHPNPAVRASAERFLGPGVTGGKVHLLDPVPYVDLVYLLSRSYMVLTDSGGIQEEAPALAKPVLVLRDVTERPEAVEVGAAIVVGVTKERIIAETNRLLSDAVLYNTMAQARFPFGDGTAAQKIAAILASGFPA